jgi:anti-sigma factor RsiW
MNGHLTTEEVQLIGDGESAASGHVRDCARCANAIVGAMQMKRAVRDSMRGDGAPASLRLRIRGESPRRMTWLVAAAAVVAIVAGSVMLSRQQSPGALSELADMHTTLLASANPVDVISTDKHTVKPWFEGRVPFAVPVPDLASTPFRLIGGRVIYLHGDQGAYLLIGKSAHRISLFVFRDRQRLGATPPAVSTMTWSNGGLEFVAVGDVPLSDLAALRGAFTP